MKIKLLLLTVLLLNTILPLFAQPKTTIELKDNWYYLNGQRFFIKAIGYEIGARPGQHPYEGVRADDLDLLKFDLKVIREGGYNTIRTWSEFSEAQLKVVQESGLKGSMGLEVNPEKDYVDPAFQPMQTFTKAAVAGGFSPATPKCLRSRQQFPVFSPPV
jgi:hypothetical protein